MATPPQQAIAKLEERIEHNKRFIEFHFELTQPHTLDFQSGQYVSVKAHENGTRRSYSITHRPDINHGFELLVDLQPGGYGSKFFEQLQFGDEVEVLAPLGRFVLEPFQPDTTLYFVASGSGIAPYKSMINDLLQLQQVPNKIELHWGMRHADELFWLDEWRELEDNFKNFTFHPVLSRPPSEWSLSRGRVTDVFKLHTLHDPAKSQIYLCGSTPMIDDMVTVAQHRGFTEDQIFHEKFY